MSSFTKPLSVTAVGSGLYRLDVGFRFYLSDTKMGEFLDIPMGFISNGASIPKGIQRQFNWNPMDVRWAQASFVHDALVGETGVKLGVKSLENSSVRYLGWKEATDWFDQALRVKRGQSADCPPLNRRLFVLAVKTWGLFRV